jgi:hypothetical protein
MLDLAELAKNVWRLRRICYLVTIISERRASPWQVRQRFRHGGTLRARWREWRRRLGHR